uniref:Radial spoke head protein 9 homolog n=1 Tax=Hucho hucho TaxID=62062 RepID=A0A4W5L0F9_9TELE
TYLQILGIQGDYFIAQGVSDDEMSHKKEPFQFQLCGLAPASPCHAEAMLAEVSSAGKGRYVGDPSHKYEHTETNGGGRGYGGGRHGEEKCDKVNEEKGLPTTVHTIVKEVSVVPRSASIKSPHGLVQTNGSFEGLSSSETGKLKGFLHFTEPQNLKKKSILEMADLDPSINFVDPLS